MAPESTLAIALHVATEEIMKALIVDDSVIIRMILRKFLASEGFETVEAKDGREALSALRVGPPPDLALFDWNMPVMSGFELVTEVRAIRAHDAMKIIMITTESLSVAQAALDAGANAYVTKPFHAGRLTEQLVALGFALASTGAGGAATRPPTAPGAVARPM